VLASNSIMKVQQTTQVLSRRSIGPPN